MGLVYKVVETSTVTDQALEAIINEHVCQGWHLDGVQFAMREASKRPAMAFVMFTIDNEQPCEPKPAGRKSVHKK